MTSSEELSDNDEKFIHDNITRDSELTKQLDEVLEEGDGEKVLAIFHLRRTGFQQSLELIKNIPLSLGAQAYVKQMKAEMEMHFKLYLLENSLENRLASLTSKIEGIEADMKKVKESYPE